MRRRNASTRWSRHSRGFLGWSRSAPNRSGGDRGSVSCPFVRGGSAPARRRRGYRRDRRHAGSVVRERRHTRAAAASTSAQMASTSTTSFISHPKVTGSMASRASWPETSSWSAPAKRAPRRSSRPSWTARTASICSFCGQAQSWYPSTSPSSSTRTGLRSTSRNIRSAPSRRTSTSRRSRHSRFPSLRSANR